MADTIRTPGSGAGIVRVHGTDKALAFTSDVTPRYVRANPVEGGKQAVAEAFRNLCAVGAKPLATTDNLNFGNPEKPEIMGQFVGAIKGIGEACARSTCRSCRAMSAFTTRPTARRSCPRPPSARWACWTTSIR
jgi:phosphoribosylformylglycinamidine (FGAM) synthase-like enzyme